MHFYASHILHGILSRDCHDDLPTALRASAVAHACWLKDPRAQSLILNGENRHFSISAGVGGGVVVMCYGLVLTVCGCEVFTHTCAVN